MARPRPAASARCRSAAADPRSAVADRSIACPRFGSRTSQVAFSSRTPMARFDVDLPVGQGGSSGTGGLISTIDERVASGAEAVAERVRARCVCSMRMLRAVWRRGIVWPDGPHLAGNAALA